jgi:MtN3 and saliva related transmembrane protein
MELSITDITGFAAGTLTTIAFLPQVLKSWKTRDLEGVSLNMYCLFTTGVALWLAYGVAMQSWPIILNNAVTLVLAGVVLYLKVKSDVMRR